MSLHDPQPTALYTLSLHDALPILEGLDALEADAKQHRQAELAKLDEQRAALDAQASMASSSQNADQVLSLAKAYTGVASYEDRKSTRLNSSHRCISYAVFCLKKKR